MQQVKAQVLFNIPVLSHQQPDEIAHMQNSNFIDLLRDDEQLDLYAEILSDSSL
jgi:hypothetical protein